MSIYLCSDYLYTKKNINSYYEGFIDAYKYYLNELSSLQ